MLFVVFLSRFGKAILTGLVFIKLHKSFERKIGVLNILLFHSLYSEAVESVKRFGFLIDNEGSIFFSNLVGVILLWFFQKWRWWKQRWRRRTPFLNYINKTTKGVVAKYIYLRQSLLSLINKQLLQASRT